MAEYLIYGKRQGKKVNGEPVFDKNFKALDSRGCRVTKLSDAMSFATKEDAQEIIDKKGGPNCIFEIRKAKG